MDGSSIARPMGLVSTSVGGQQDTLFRIVYYGEALRAMTEHVSDALISGPCEPMIGMLDDAYDRFAEARESFSPEEFTLYVMSQMLSLCEDAEEARQFRLGAATYIIRSASALPEDYAPIIADAQQMVRAEELARLAAPTPETRTEAAPEPAPETGSEPAVPDAVAAHDALPETQTDADPIAPEAPAARVRDGAGMSGASVDANRRPQRARLPRAVGGGSRSGIVDYLEKGFVALTVVGIFGYLLLFSLGALDAPDTTMDVTTGIPVID